MKQNDYYNKRKKRLIVQLQKLISRNRQVLMRDFNERQTESIIADTLGEYEAMIPRIPYIGGSKNFLTRNLVGSAQLLSLIRVLEKRGLSEKEIGKMLHDIYESHLAALPGIVRFILKKIYLTPIWQKRIQRNGIRSQMREYPGDWVSEYIPGNGTDFVFGVNFHECGICKFYKTEGAEKYLPYLCLLDYPLFKMMGIRLMRSETLGNGASRCDFRFGGNRPPVEGWPPESVEEYRAVGR
ncbi:MAG: L-2-amino-thiazoline-4-carboxylic acid hydrolase [Spirochaetes bacterium]|nr:L-2-amino-thiazoline-4-carboxylic acid hydrolase [Spirochaetota bacterium]